MQDVRNGVNRVSSFKSGLLRTTKELEVLPIKLVSSYRLRFD